MQCCLAHDIPPGLWDDLVEVHVCRYICRSFHKSCHDGPQLQSKHQVLFGKVLMNKSVKAHQQLQYSFDTCKGIVAELLNKNKSAVTTLYL